MTPQEQRKLLTHRGNEHHHNGMNEDIQLLDESLCKSTIDLEIRTRWMKE
jgi:hypothetical protein